MQNRTFHYWSHPCCSITVSYQKKPGFATPPVYGFILDSSVQGPQISEEMVFATAAFIADPVFGAVGVRFVVWVDLIRFLSLR